MLIFFSCPHTLHGILNLDLLQITGSQQLIIAFFKLITIATQVAKIHAEKLISLLIAVEHFVVSGSHITSFDIFVVFINF
jgi:hypothetical protein